MFRMVFYLMNERVITQLIEELWLINQHQYSANGYLLSFLSEMFEEPWTSISLRRLKDNPFRLPALLQTGRQFSPYIFFQAQPSAEIIMKSHPFHVSLHHLCLNRICSHLQDSNSICLRGIVRAWRFRNVKINLLINVVSWPYIS